MENWKSFFIGAWIVFTSYLNPISSDIKILLLVFGMNFIFGLASGIFVNNEKFSFQKAWKCIMEACVFFVLIASVYFIGEHKDSKEEILQCISFITFSVVYFYGVNILRNMKLIMPGNKAIAFLYDVFSIEIAIKLPFLKDYLDKHKNKYKDPDIQVQENKKRKR